MLNKDMYLQLNTILGKEDFAGFLQSLFLPWAQVEYVYDKNILAQLHKREKKFIALSGSQGLCGCIVFEESLFSKNIWGLVSSLYSELSAVASRVKEHETNLLVIKKINALCNVQMIANSALEIQEVYHKIAAELLAFINFDRASVTMFNKENGLLHTFAVYNEGKTKLGNGEYLPLEGTAPSWVLEHGKINIENDISKEGKFLEDDILLIEGYRSALRAPMFFKGEMVGTMNFNSKRPFNYTSFDAEMLEQVAAVLAYSITNSILIKETQKSTLELEIENRKLQLLNKIAQLFSAVTEAKFSFREIFKEIVKALKLTSIEYYFHIDNKLHYETYSVHKEKEKTKIVAEIKAKLKNQGVYVDGLTDKVYLLVQLANLETGYLILSITDKAAVSDDKYMQLLTKQMSIGTENYLMFNSIRKLNDYDGLTGLPNKKRFLNDIGREIARAKRSQSKLVVLIADIDDFKVYNDCYGHVNGDNILKEVAYLINSTLREIDLVGRFGGEEFLIALPNTGLASGVEYANRLAGKLSEHAVASQITISIGITELMANDVVSSFIARADNALYNAKAYGKNQVVIA